MIELIIAVVCLVMLFIMGIIEKHSNDVNVEKIAVRINVNGIRGKSTITRLTAAVLKEAGYKVIAKTTGTAARMIYWDNEEEMMIIRGMRGANIVEQVHVIKHAATIGANALVCECMAVDPQLQKVYQHQILKSTITIIANVIEDHLDVMGPTTKEIACAFSRTIPKGGTVIVPDCEFTDFFREEAKKVGATVVVADESAISQSFLDKFKYYVFPNNCAMALAVADILGIDREVAFRGMLNAHPDPGAMEIQSATYGDSVATLINAFAANEPHSSYEIWKRIAATPTLPTSDPIVLFNARPDRVDRTRQFAQDFLHLIPNATLVVVGENTYPVDRAYRAGKYPNVASYINLERKSAEVILTELEKIMDGRLILCVGNIHGVGEELLDALMEGGYSGMTITADKISTDVE